MSERVSSERLLALRQVVAVSAHLSLGEQEQVLLDLLDARTAFNEFQDEWSERFGFLAIKNQRDSLESIDEVACILNAANHSIRGEMEEGWRIANKEGARADIAEQRIAELERELEEARKAFALREEVNPNVDGLVGPCQICGTAPLTLDYLVDDAYWDANIPGSLRAKLICLACLVRQAGSTALHHVRVIYLTFGGLTQAFVPIGRQNSNPAARAAGKEER